MLAAHPEGRVSMGGHISVEQAYGHALDALPATEREQVEAHVADCPECAARLGEARRDCQAIHRAVQSYAARIRPGPVGWAAVAPRVLGMAGGRRPLVARLAAGGASALVLWLVATGGIALAVAGVAAVPPVRERLRSAIHRLQPDSSQPATSTPTPSATVTESPFGAPGSVSRTAVAPAATPGNAADWRDMEREDSHREWPAPAESAAPGMPTATAAAGFPWPTPTVSSTGSAAAPVSGPPGDSARGRPPHRVTAAAPGRDAPPGRGTPSGAGEGPPRHSPTRGSAGDGLPRKSVTPGSPGHGPPPQAETPGSPGDGPPHQTATPGSRGHSPPHRTETPGSRGHGPPDRTDTPGNPGHGPPHRTATPGSPGHGPPLQSATPGTHEPGQPPGTVPPNGGHKGPADGAAPVKPIGSGRGGDQGTARPPRRVDTDPQTATASEPTPTPEPPGLIGYRRAHGDQGEPTPEPPGLVLSRP